MTRNVTIAPIDTGTIPNRAMISDKNAKKKKCTRWGSAKFTSPWARKRRRLSRRHRTTSRPRSRCAERPRSGERGRHHRTFAAAHALTLNPGLNYTERKVRSQDCLSHCCFITPAWSCPILDMFMLFTSEGRDFCGNTKGTRGNAGWAR